MGSQILHKSLGFHMSNSSTSIFHATLALELSEFATSDREKEIALWFCTRDYPCFGSNLAGFALHEIPWPHQTFDSAKAFVLKVVKSAIDGKTWRKLGTSVTEGDALAHLNEFRALVEAFSSDDVKEESSISWKAERPETVEKCTQHKVYLHWHGCILCNYLRDYAPVA
jgi:hypothetical protein